MQYIRKFWTRITRIALMVAVALSISYAPSVVSMESLNTQESAQPNYHLIVENRTAWKARIAIAPVPGDFFFAEEFGPFEKRAVYDEHLGVGPFMFCWMTEVDMQPNCVRFMIEECNIPTLLDEEVDIWVEPKTKS